MFARIRLFVCQAPSCPSRPVTLKYFELSAALSRASSWFEPPSPPMTPREMRVARCPTARVYAACSRYAIRRASVCLSGLFFWSGHACRPGTPCLPSPAAEVRLLYTANMSMSPMSVCLSPSTVICRTGSPLVSLPAHVLLPPIVCWRSTSCSSCLSPRSACLFD